MTDIQAEQQGGEQQPDRPEWLLEKFESPEAQARAYAEAEKEMNRIRADQERERQQFAQALQAFEAQQSEPQQPVYAPGYAAQQDPLLAAAQRAMDEGDVATLLAITTQINQAGIAPMLDQRFSQLEERIGGTSNQIKEQTLMAAGQRVAPLFGDRWSEIVPHIQERIDQNPALLPANANVESYTQAITNIAKMIDYDRVVAAQSALEQERRDKLAAQTLEGGQARAQYRADPNEKAWGEIKGSKVGSWSEVVGG